MYAERTHQDSPRSAMNVSRFADDCHWLLVGDMAWLVHAHRRCADGRQEAATAAILIPTDRPIRVPAIGPESRKLARRTAFGPATSRRPVDLDSLRSAVGPVDWSDAWTPRLRSIEGAVVDTVLLARALDCFPDGGRATLEIGPMMSAGGSPGQLIRLAGADWRMVVAGRIEPTAPELELTRPSGRRPSAPRRRQTFPPTRRVRCAPEDEPPRVGKHAADPGKDSRTDEEAREYSMDETSERRREDPVTEVGTRAWPTYHPIEAGREPLVRSHCVDGRLAKEQIDRWLEGGSP